jgi:hypothetical protein
MVPISLAAAWSLKNFYISTFRSMCAVLNMAVLCSFLNSRFPGMVITYFLNDFEMVSVALIITGIIIIINCNSVFTWWQQSLHQPQTAVTQYRNPHTSTDSCHSVQQSLNRYRQLSLSTAFLTPVQTAVTQYSSPYTSRDSCHSVQQSLHQNTQLLLSTAVLTPVETVVTQ